MILAVGKPVPVSLCRPQIPHGLELNQTRVSTARCRALTFSTTARTSAPIPISIATIELIFNTFISDSHTVILSFKSYLHIHDETTKPTRTVNNILHQLQLRNNTGLFKMIVGVQLSSGNSAPNSGNNHHLTIPFQDGMQSLKRQGACVSRN